MDCKTLKDYKELEQMKEKIKYELQGIDMSENEIEELALKCRHIMDEVERLPVYFCYNETKCLWIPFKTEAELQQKCQIIRAYNKNHRYMKQTYKNVTVHIFAIFDFKRVECHFVI